MLATNNDFDENRIDPETGYAIPDCDDENSSLKAQRDSIEDAPLQVAAGDRVTDDLHRGWFGISPTGMGKEFFANSQVTIRKLDKMDPDTGYAESGKVRLHATWENGGEFSLDPHDPHQENSGDPDNLVGTVYGTNINADDIEYWIEGVEPGKITLEWRMRKGSMDIRHEQSFVVRTEKSKQEWIDDIRNQILLESDGEIDMHKFDPSKDFVSDSHLYLARIYEYYYSLFTRRPEEYLWAGLAKLAGGPVYGGVSDASYPPDTIYVALDDPSFAIPTGFDELRETLMEMAQDVYEDISWQFRAYDASGIEAIRHVAESQGVPGQLVDLPDWDDFDRAVHSTEEAFADAAIILRENGDLLRREQRDTLSAGFGNLKADGWSAMFSFFAENPIPSGPKFKDVVPGGDITGYSDRWKWVKTDTSRSMFRIWSLTSKTRKLQFGEVPLRSHAENYAWLPIRPIF